MPIERAVTLHRYMVQCCVTTYSPTDGIVLWELQEQKCQQLVYQHSDVGKTRLAGYRLLVLKWKKVKFTGRSALVIALLVANTQTWFLLKFVDPTLSTNFITHQGVAHATVVQTECEAKNSRNKRAHKLILGYTYLRDFAKSCFCVIIINPFHIFYTLMRSW